MTYGALDLCNLWNSWPQDVVVVPGLDIFKKGFKSNLKSTQSTASSVVVPSLVPFQQIFHPETTDIYDKKNMPRVVYCIHALRCAERGTGAGVGEEDIYEAERIKSIFLSLPPSVYTCTNVAWRPRSRICMGRSTSQVGSSSCQDLSQGSARLVVLI